jgi:predicted molibdopterin-dependent oxidoreductase YjgC
MAACVSKGVSATISSVHRSADPALDQKNGEFQEASWDEALDFVAEKLTALKENHGPESIGLLTSARISNEENYVAQKFARAVLKTNNVDHCARL